MHDKSNEFEKQVREKLQDLHFTPSRPVWERVAAELPSKQRRRSYIVWGSLLAAAMMGGFLFFYPKTDADTTKSTFTASRTEKHIGETGQESGRNTISPGSQATDAPGPDQEGSLKPDLAEARNPGGVPEKSGDLSYGTEENSSGNNRPEPVSPSDLAAKSRSGVNRQESTSLSHLAAKSHPEKTISDIAAINKPAENQEKAADNQPLTERGRSERQPPLTGKNGSEKRPLLSPDLLAGSDPVSFRGRTDSSKKILVPAPISGAGYPYHKSYSLTAPQKTFVARNAITIAPDAVAALTGRNKWNLEPGFNAGQSIFNSGTVNKLFRAADPTVLNNRNSVQNQPSLQSPGMTLAAATRKPSEIKPGKSIAVGMDLRRALTRRLSVSAGLYYNLLTTNMKVGDKIEQEMYVQQGGQEKVLGEYYNTGSANDYTNNYHFIELPVLLNIQLNRGRKIPLYMSGGVSFARLVSTNALYYDGTQNVYYADKALVKKNFVNVQSGFSAKFPAGKNLALLAGPEIQYGLTNMLRGKDGNSDKHSLFIGIKVGLSF